MDMKEDGDDMEAALGELITSVFPQLTLSGGRSKIQDPP